MRAPRRQRAPVQVNQFVGGLNTEANPLNFPPTASIDESNMDINTDGSRSRRLGFDLEASFVENDTTVTPQQGEIMARGQFLWENTGGVGDKQLMVVQLGNYMAIHDLDNSVLSSAPIFTKIFDVDVYINNFDFAVVDGVLVVATGQREIYSFEYEDGAIRESSQQLLIRDFFGVTSNEGETVLTRPQNIQKRPQALGGRHAYNLRNQTFALPRVTGEDDNTNLIDPIELFHSASLEIDSNKPQYPSNADNSVKFVFADANKSSDREVERFFASTMIKTLPASTEAPKGYFIIDALERGNSREMSEEDLVQRHPELTVRAHNLPTDRTPGGATCLAQYAGRIWYSGFSGDIIDGDENSPRMSSYVLFSQVVQTPSDIALCYQEADPTSIDDPDLADTDGGFLKIDGAYNIKALIPVDSSLFVLAENGVWRVVGIDENTFTATGYSVFKVSEEGIISKNSAVVSGKSLSYWGEDAIYVIEYGETGLWRTNNLTQTTIQTLYDSIPPEDKANSFGFYDGQTLTVRWLWGADLSQLTEVNELVLNLKYTSFTKNKIPLGANVAGVPSLAGGNSLALSPQVPLTVNGDVLFVGLEEVTVPAKSIQRGSTLAYYVVVLDYTTTIKYSFGRYNRLDTFYDWGRAGTPVTNSAYLLTGAITGGSSRLRKDVPYLTLFFRESDPDSSCLMSARWNWSPDVTSGRWSSARQTYRQKSYAESGGVVVTRSRVRGSGNSVAFYLESEADLPMHIYGWEFNLEAVENE